MIPCLHFRGSASGKKLVSNHTATLRDSAVLLVLFIIGGVVWGGPEWGVAIAASGVLALINFFLLGMLVQRLVASGNNFLVGLGFFLKLGITGGALIGLMKLLPAAPVLLGFGVVLLGITVRGIVAMPTLPDGVESV